MENNSNENRSGLLKFSSKSYEEYFTYKKIHLHLRDINDVITEEDIQMVRTDIFYFTRRPDVEEKKSKRDLFIKK